MYDPIVLSKKVEQVILNNMEKKYYRFRKTGFYGGIATADTVGCNLRCKFCWSQNSVWNAGKTGSFYSPEDVAEKLSEIAQEHKYHQARVSGGEPTLGQKHLLNILENIDSNLLFILETNGILLGSDQSYVKELSHFSNLHIRVCLKGCNSEEFSLLTGAERGFELQLRALGYLRDAHISFHIALVSMSKDKQRLYDKLGEMGIGNIMLEEEEIKLYPPVKKRLEQEGILGYFI